MGGCLFCTIASGERDPGVLAYADDDVVVFPTKDQRRTNLGHMLVAPRLHFDNLYDLPPSLDSLVWGCVRRVALAIQAEFNATGTTVRLNNGEPGQDVFHMHVHVIPRHLDDNALSAPSEELSLDARVELAARVARALASRE